MIRDLINQLLPLLAQLGTWGYWLALLIASLETTIGIGPLIPGSTVVLFLGALAARGYLELYPLLGFAILGAIIGDNINFALGKRYGARWQRTGIWFLKARHLEKVRGFVARHGPKSIFLARFLPSGKEVVPFIAGVGQMGWGRFMLWNILGAVGWGLEWVGCGYLFGQSLALAELWLSRAGFFFALLLLGFLLLSLCKWLLLRAGQEAGNFLRALWQSLAALFLAQPGVEGFCRRHRPAMRWGAARFRCDSLLGLPLSIFLAVLFALLLLSGQPDLDPAWARVDRRLSNLLAVFHTEFLTAIFARLALLGEGQTVVLLTALVMVVLGVSRKFSQFWPLLTGVGGSLGSAFFFGADAVAVIPGYGFPAYLLIRGAGSWPEKVNLFFVTLGVLLLIGLSRLYLGEHYLSEVAGGYLVGGMWLAVAITLGEWRRELARPPLAGARPLALALLGAFLIYLFLRPLPPVGRQSPAPQPVVVATPVEILAGEEDKYSETIFGERQEPLNFIFLAREEEQLLAVLEQAGYQRLADAGFPGLLQLARSWTRTGPEALLPISPTFWQTRIQDFNFRRPAAPARGDNVHRLRLWRSNGVTVRGERIFLGLANATAGLQWGWLPRLSPALDEEREFLLRALVESGRVMVEKIPLLPPLTGKNFIGARFATSGQLYLLRVAE